MPRPARFYYSDDLPDDLFPADDPRWIVAQFLLDQIHWHQQVRHRIAEIEQDADYGEIRWIALKMKYLQDALPRKYRTLFHPTVRRLRARGVIVTQEHCELSHKCRRYSITPKYRDNVKLHFCEDQTVNAKLAKLRERYLPAPVHRWLTGHLSDVSIDMHKAEEVARMLKPKNDAIPVAEYQAQQLMAARAIDDGSHNPVVCSYGRFHSAVTGLNKSLRGLLALRGEPVVELDVTNMQPLLLGMLARDWVRMNARDRDRFTSRKFADETDRYRFRKDMRSGRCDVEDIEVFVELCELGRIYEYFKQPGMTREQIKQQFIQVLFDKVKPTQLWERLMNEFPSIAKLVYIVKRRKHARLAWILQNAESSIIIDGACKRIMKERPRTPVVTIHDCLLVRQRDVNYIKAVMLDEFAQRSAMPKIT